MAALQRAARPTLKELLLADDAARGHPRAAARPVAPAVASRLRLTGAVYLLDTNIVSELRRARPHGAVLAWLRAADDADLHLSP